MADSTSLEEGTNNIESILSKVAINEYPKAYDNIINSLITDCEVKLNELGEGNEQAL